MPGKGTALIQRQGWISAGVLVGIQAAAPPWAVLLALERLSRTDAAALGPRQG